MGERLLALLRSIFESDKAIVTEDGQRVIGFDAIEAAVTGEKLFDDEELKGEATPPEYATAEMLAGYITRDELVGATGGLIDAEFYHSGLSGIEKRLAALEALILNVDGIETSEDEVELWG